MKATKYQIEYRNNGHWYPLGAPYSTKKEAQEYAKTSHSCQRNGYQIKNVSVTVRKAKKSSKTIVTKGQINKLERFIAKYHDAVNAEQADDVTPRQEARAIDQQFAMYEKIEAACSKTHLKRIAKESPAVKAFIKEYM